MVQYNKIEDTPILKLAIVKSLYVKKLKFAKKFVKKIVKNSSENLSKNLSP